MAHRSQFGVLNHFTKKIGEALSKKGFVCRYFEANEYENYLSQEPSDYLFGINGSPQHSSGIYLSDLVERPYICYLVDLSYRYFYLMDSPTLSFICNDHFSCDLLKQRGHARNGFFPLGVDADISYNPLDDRPYEIVLLATFIDFEGRQKSWKHLYSEEIYNAMNAAIEMTFSNETMPFIQAFVSAVNSMIKEGKDIQINQKILTEILIQLELYIRGKQRVDLINAITDSTIHVFDASVDPVNWKKYLTDKKNKNIIFHPPVSYEENLEVMKKSKIVLNSNPHVRNGAHERVFNALACGALPFTNASIYMNEILKDGQDFIVYKQNELSQINEKVNFYLNHADQREEIVKSGNQKVMQNHTWEKHLEAFSFPVP